MRIGRLGRAKESLQEVEVLEEFGVVRSAARPSKQRDRTMMRAILEVAGERQQRLDDMLEQ
jgi:hypothetical protein